MITAADQTTKPGSPVEAPSASASTKSEQTYSPEIVATHQTFVRHKRSFDVAHAAFAELVEAHNKNATLATFTNLCRNVDYAGTELVRMGQTQEALRQGGAPAHQLDSHIANRMNRLEEQLGAVERLSVILHPRSIAQLTEGQIAQQVATFGKEYSGAAPGRSPELTTLRAALVGCIDESTGLIDAEKLQAFADRVRKKESILLENGETRRFTRAERSAVLRLVTAVRESDMALREEIAVARKAADAAGIEAPPRALDLPSPEQRVGAGPVSTPRVDPYLTSLEEMEAARPAVTISAAPKREQSGPSGAMAEMLELAANPIESRADRVWQGKERAILAPPQTDSAASAQAAEGAAPVTTLPVIKHRDMTLTARDQAQGLFELEVQVSVVEHSVRKWGEMLFGAINSYSHVRKDPANGANALVQFLNAAGSAPTAVQLEKLTEQLSRSNGSGNNPLSRVAAAAEAVGLRTGITGIEAMEARSLSRRGSKLVAPNLLVFGGAEREQEASINSGELYGAKLKGLCTQGKVSINQVDARKADISDAAISLGTTINKTDLRGANLKNLKIELTITEPNPEPTAIPKKFNQFVSAEAALSGELGADVQALAKARLLELFKGSVIDKGTKFDPLVKEYLWKNSTPVSSVGQAIYGSGSVTPNSASGDTVVVNGSAVDQPSSTNMTPEAIAAEESPWFRAMKQAADELDERRRRERK